MERGGFKVSKGVCRRSRLDIVADILETSRGRAKKTDLMSRCNMSFIQLEKYLDLVLTTRLLMVENDSSHILFRISGKGRKFLKAYHGLKILIE